MQKIVVFFRKAGVDKEERAEYIGLQSARIAWLFTTIVLLIWSIQGLIASGRLEPQVAVFVASQLVFWLALLIFRKKYGG